MRYDRGGHGLTMLIDFVRECFASHELSLPTGRQALATRGLFGQTGRQMFPSAVFALWLLTLAIVQVLPNSVVLLSGNRDANPWLFAWGHRNSHGCSWNRLGGYHND